jgi:hypothetical protein
MCGVLAPFASIGRHCGQVAASGQSPDRRWSFGGRGELTGIGHRGKSSLARTIDEEVHDGRHDKVDMRPGVGRVLASEHADLVREGVALILRGVREIEVAGLAAPIGMSALASWPVTETATGHAASTPVSAPSSSRSRS